MDQFESLETSEARSSVKFVIAFVQNYPNVIELEFKKVFKLSYFCQRKPETLYLLREHTKHSKFCLKPNFTISFEEKSCKKSTSIVTLVVFCLFLYTKKERNLFGIRLNHFILNIVKRMNHPNRPLYSLATISTSLC